MGRCRTLKGGLLALAFVIVVFVFASAPSASRRTAISAGLTSRKHAPRNVGDGRDDGKQKRDERDCNGYREDRFDRHQGNQRDSCNDCKSAAASKERIAPARVALAVDDRRRAFFSSLSQGK